MKLNRILLTLSALMSVAAMADETLSSYDFSVYLPARNFTCAEEAQQLKAVFSAQKNILNVTADCISETTVNWDNSNSTLYSVVVNYQALPANKLTITRNTYAESTSWLMPRPDAMTGAYATYADCLSDIAFRKTEVSQNTGLTILAANCVPATYVHPGQAYALNVFGIGTAKTNLYGFNDEFIGSYLSNTVQQSILNFIDAQGIHRVYTNGLNFLYFAASPIRIESKDVGYTQNPAECEAQVASIQLSFEKAKKGNTNPILAYCSPLSNAPAATTYLRYIAGNNAVNPWVESSNSPNGYYSFNDCMNDRARVLNKKQTQLPADTLMVGAFCEHNSFESLSYTMKLFYAPQPK